MRNLTYPSATFFRVIFFIWIRRFRTTNTSFDDKFSEIIKMIISFYDHRPDTRASRTDDDRANRSREILCVLWGIVARLDGPWRDGGRWRHYTQWRIVIVEIGTRDKTLISFISFSFSRTGIQFSNSVKHKIVRDVKRKTIKTKNNSEYNSELLFWVIFWLVHDEFNHK